MSYIKTKYSRGIVPLLSSFPSLLNPKQGETAFCSENGRVMTYDGELWMCDDFIKLTNASGSSVAVGDIMTFQTTAGTTLQAITVANLGNELVAGVVIYAANNNNPVALAYKGIYKVNIQSWSGTAIFPTNPPTNNGYLFRQSSTLAKGGIVDVASATSLGGILGWTVEIPTTLGLTKCLIRSKVEYT